MKSWPVAALLAVGLTACMTPAASADDRAASWITDYAKATAAARAAGKPIFLVFR